MKRRQVISGFLAMTAAGLMPRPTWQSLSSDQTGSDAHFLPMLDTDSVFVDPISDNENRIVTSPAPQSVAIDKPAISENEKLVVATEKKTKQVILTPIIEASSHVESSADIKSSAKQAPQKALAVESKTKAKVANKNIDFERDYDDDIFVTPEEAVLLHSVALRLKNLQNTIGYGNFNIVSFDDAIRYAKRYSKIGMFTAEETDFIEKIFFRNAADYGFYGKKVTDALTSKIGSKAAFKVPHTGHFLLKEQSLAFYEKLRKNVGGKIILTSGIRSNVKQLHLFLAKVIRVNGNLSRASRSLAPPGYSYHGIGDFDVGRMGWGGKNFTDAFASTTEFKRMTDLGYIDIRYEHGNELGVRFEPWHIKVV